MEVVVDVSHCLQVLVLHLPAGLALSAGCGLVRENDLVDDYVVNIYVELSQLNCKSLRLIYRKELRNANRHESSSLRVLELLVDGFNFCLELVQGLK